MHYHRNWRLRNKPPKCTAAKSKNYSAVMCSVILTNGLYLRYCSLIPRLPPSYIMEVEWGLGMRLALRYMSGSCRGLAHFSYVHGSHTDCSWHSEVVTWETCHIWQIPTGSLATRFGTTLDAVYISINSQICTWRILARLAVGAVLCQGLSVMLHCPMRRLGQYLVKLCNVPSALG